MILRCGKGGFTLVEVMIVMAILAILAAVAIGIYDSYIKTSFEVDPVQVLMTAASAMESYYADHDTYPRKIEDLPAFNDGTPDNRYVLHKDKDARRRFVIKIDNASESAYCLSVENDASSEKWKIKWVFCCNATASIGSCKPVQVKGSEILKRLF